MRTALRVFLGLLLGLLLAEGAFWIRDGGAFPHVNIYLPDDVLGTRLRPRAEQRISFSGNPVTRFRTNALGFRGDDWPAPKDGAREVLVVGDSQVFGLGVEGDQTFSAQLAARLHRPVLNAGVPTYGPAEYLEVARRTIEARPSIDTLVLGLNLANDVFEAGRPNRERHAVWDGWAVRVETAPHSAPLAFPFRGWVMSRSHLVFALRSLLHRGAPRDPEGGFPSEGGFEHLLVEAKDVSAQDAAEAARSTELARVLEERTSAAHDLRQANTKVYRAVTEHSDDETAQALKTIAKYDGDPRDILRPRFAEMARPVDATATALVRAALALRANEAALKKVTALARDRALTGALDERGRAEDRLRAAEAASHPVSTASTSSALGVVIAEAQQLADAHGVTLVVLVLPLDVQVSSDEWKKYGLPVTDVSATRALNADAMAQAARVGARGADPLPALALTTGAFLDGDLHLTAKGHGVVADVLAEVMARPVTPPADADPTVLPPGRSYLPSHESWRLAPEVTVRGSSNARCETKVIREWFRMICRDDGTLRPVIVDDLEGGRGEAYVFTVAAGYGGPAGARLDDVGLLVPLPPGDTVRATVRWTTHSQRLELTRATAPPPDGGAPALGAFAERRPAPTDRSAREALPHVVLDSDDAYHLDPHCADDDPAACVLGGPYPRVRCADGFVSFGVMGRCAADCSAQPCADGLTCQGWLGRQGCVR